MQYCILCALILGLLLVPSARSVAIRGVIGGIDASTGQRPSRQEFTTFASSGPAFDLYLLSLQKFQQQNQSGLLSYYQVSGEH